MRDASFDYSEYTNWVNNLKLATADFDAFLTKFLTDLAMETIGLIKERTPVDTGLLRNSWELESVVRSGNDVIATIVNNVYYASYVEYGHATRNGGYVKGRYMARISLALINQRLPVEFHNAFLDFLVAHGVG